MEMKMIGSEDIEMGSDITPWLRPLCSSLYDSFLGSHCSSCFSVVTVSDHHHHHAPPLLYCSPLCQEESLHLPCDPPSSPDLRAALRFLLLLDQRPLLLHRLAGLLTNHHAFLLCGADDDLVSTIRTGARALAAATSTLKSHLHLEEAVLCLLVTNAVEVHDPTTGLALGIALYDFRFSWINHSCSPNASYHFLLSPPSSSSSSSSTGEPTLKILPSQLTGKSSHSHSDCGHAQPIQGCQEYGPRVIVRSIKRIPKGQQVTVTYTDLLVPKAMRQSELWLKYRFICRCRRCSVLPLSYVDHALQEICYHLEPSNLSFKNNIFLDEAAKMLDDWISNAIDEYLSDGNPESCCKKLESILTVGIHSKEDNPQIKFRLYPLHHLSLSAYTTLASVHRLCASDLLAHNSNTDKLEGFRRSRASAAYSLLLGGATHHLFQSESSLIASVANFWTNAGESLLTLARSSAWSLLGKPALPGVNRSSFAKHECTKCSLMDKFEENLHSSQSRNADLEEITEEFLCCIRSYTHQVWIFLIHKCHYLEGIKDPIDFSWLETTKYLGLAGVDSLSRTEVCNSRFEMPMNAAEVRISIYKLGFHCLLYGALLSNMYYGQYSHLLCHIQDIINLENNEKI